mgnify:FL=1
MVFKRKNKWIVDITVGGRNGKRYRKRFDTQAEAKRYEAHSTDQHRLNPEWNTVSEVDNRRLDELIDQWYLYHGKHLKDGTGRLGVLKLLVDKLGNPRICNFNKKDFLKYRNQRTDISPNTINHHQAYLSAVFNELTRLDILDQNPLQGIKRFKIAERELNYLTKEQINSILPALKKRSMDTYIAVKICLSVGTRWSEAVGVKAKNIINNRISLIDTKNGKTRQLPINKDLALEIKENAPFKNGYSTFSRVLRELGIETPKGQLTHILRHTFASHFIMNGGDILTLQKTLGHSDLKMTMRYAHLSPEHLEKIVNLNPLSA